jgi:hypothetical protein
MYLKIRSSGGQPIKGGARGIPVFYTGTVGEAAFVKSKIGYYNFKTTLLKK